MVKARVLVSSLVILLIVETAFIAAQYFRTGNSASSHPQFLAVAEQSFVVPYFLFNRPISNGTTEYHLPEALNHSWVVTVQSHLQSAPNMQTSSLAEIALAPEYPVENRSIPTIIIQERGDGLLRVEYFPQSWPGTFGLLLYNSTSPSWLGSQNVTLTFMSYGPPSAINPQLAPKPNGNLTLTIGNTIVLSDYPTAWANLASFYVFGLRGSSFTEGDVYMYAAWN